MTERKNLEHLFQEKLDNFEVIPPEEVWLAIETELQKKEKKRRIIPFWWKFSGIAALLVIGFSLYTFDTSNPGSKNNISKKDNSVVITEKKGRNSTENKRSIGKNNSNNTENNTISSFDKKENKNLNSSVTYIKPKNQSIHKTSSQTNENYSNKKEVLATISNTKKRKKTKNMMVENENEAIVYRDVQKSKKNTNSVENISIVNENKTIAVPKETVSDDGKIAMEIKSNAISSKEDAIKKLDSTSIAKVELNAMEELLKMKEKESAQKQKINRWQVTPNLAPVYFGSFENGSPLDETLNENKKTYNNTMSYGLAVNYAVNKKIQVRTGIQVISVDYDTQGIVFYQDTKATMMKNLNPTTQGSFIQIKPLTNVESQLDRVISERFDGVLNQKMGYVEMPVEMTYKLFGRKFGVDVIGGFSTLFLNKNEIYLKSDGLNMKIGSASNLNNIHFSTNLGLGLNYSVFKNFSARIEPTFKYQINTFSSDSGSFKPFLFGIYSGISYKF